MITIQDSEVPTSSTGRPYILTLSGLRTRDLFRLIRILPLLWVLAHSPLSGADDKAITARWTGDPIHIDGELSEPAWDLAESVSDFVQAEPHEGGAPSEETEVRVLFDNNRLYIGVYLYDSAPDQILINDLRRDFRTFDSDVFGVVVDAFHAQRSSMAFFTNPGGAKQDSEALSDGRHINTSWDGIWYTASKIQEDGWSTEIVIPFKTLRFEVSDTQIMGINFKRRIRRKNEDLYWSPVPRRYTIHRVSLAGILPLGRELKPGRNLQIKPFVTADHTHMALGDSISNDFTADVGGDIKYSLTPGLTLDGTYNTDFSQVEVDTQQINLTRFSLFFPEKREFFLENADLFQFGDIPRERGPSRTEEIQLFYSRRIGLSSEGQPLPLLGGARLSGRVGHFALGLLNIQQEESEETPSNNFTVMRLRYDILKNSDIGGIFINRNGGLSGDYNRSYGADVNLQFVQSLTINSYVAGTQSPGAEGEDLVTKFSSQWNDGFLEGRFIFQDIGENFNPEVGFVGRAGVRAYQANLALRPRPGGDGFIREFHPHANLKYYTDRDNILLTRDWHLGFQIFFRDRSSFEVSTNPQFERLRAPFRIREGITIPVGDYNFSEWFRLGYNSDPSKLLSARINWSEWDFFDGTRTSLNLSGTLLVKPRLEVSLNYRHNSVEVESGGFTADLYGFRFQYSFNPAMFAELFLQYNKDTNKILTNARFNLIHRPLSDITLVLTEERSTESAVTDTSRAIIFKYTHLLQF